MNLNNTVHKKDQSNINDADIAYLKGLAYSDYNSCVDTSLSHLMAVQATDISSTLYYGSGIYGSVCSSLGSYLVN